MALFTNDSRGESPWFGKDLLHLYKRDKSPSESTRIEAVTILKDLFFRYVAYLSTKSVVLVAWLRSNMRIVAGLWLAFAALAAILRFSSAATPVGTFAQAWPIALAYSLIIVAPLCGYLVASHAFPEGKERKRLDFNLAFVGRWRALAPAQARANPFYGPTGLMASVLIGMMLTVFFRAGEFFLSIPAIGATGPAWAQVLFGLMAFDAAMVGFFYMVAFVMAIRAVPLFPRMLVFAWLLDVSLQLFVASRLGPMASLPGTVSEPLHALISGNITKVMIGAAIWLPYLLLSERVNVTYRCRSYCG